MYHLLGKETRNQTFMTFHHKARLFWSKKRKIFVFFKKQHTYLIRGIVHQSKYIVMMTKERVY